jgi:1-deoxy-D-xylulose-5-phosphate reductoisomerase
VHSFVEFVDGSLKAQLGLPDMRIPIQYSVTYPQRTVGPAPRLELTEHPQMSFEAPDQQRFPAISIARAAGIAGPGATAALIAADDIAVERYLAGSLAFPGMAELVEAAVSRFSVDQAPDREELEHIDAEVRAWARQAEVGGTPA